MWMPKGDDVPRWPAEDWPPRVRDLDWWPSPGWVLVLILAAAVIAYLGISR